MKGIDSRNIVSGVGSGVMIAVIMRVAKKTFALFLFKESRSIMPYFTRSVRNIGIVKNIAEPKMERTTK